MIDERTTPKEYANLLVRNFMVAKLESDLAIEKSKYYAVLGLNENNPQVAIEIVKGAIIVKEIERQLNELRNFVN